MLGEGSKSSGERGEFEGLRGKNKEGGGKEKTEGVAYNNSGNTDTRRGRG